MVAWLRSSSACAPAGLDDSPRAQRRGSDVTNMLNMFITIFLLQNCCLILNSMQRASLVPYCSGMCASIDRRKHDANYQRESVGIYLHGS